jgi:hypothetical protein
MMIIDICVARQGRGGCEAICGGFMHWCVKIIEHVLITTDMPWICAQDPRMQRKEIIFNQSNNRMRYYLIIYLFP